MDMTGRWQLMVIGSFEWSTSQKCASSLILTLSRSNLKTQQSPAAILDLCFGQGNHVIIVTSSFSKAPTLKEQCHEDFAVLGQFCAKIITLRL